MIWPSCTLLAMDSDPFALKGLGIYLHRQCDLHYCGSQLSREHILLTVSGRGGWWACPDRAITRPQTGDQQTGR